MFNKKNQSFVLLFILNFFTATNVFSIGEQNDEQKFFDILRLFDNFIIGSKKYNEQELALMPKISIINNHLTDRHNFLDSFKENGNPLCEIKEFGGKFERSKVVKYYIMQSIFEYNYCQNKLEWRNLQMKNLAKSLAEEKNSVAGNQLFQEYCKKADSYKKLFENDIMYGSLRLIKKEYSKKFPRVNNVLFEYSDNLAKNVLNRNCKLYGPSFNLAFSKNSSINIESNDIRDVLDDVRLYADFMNYLKNQMPTDGASEALAREAFYISTDINQVKERQHVILELQKNNIVKKFKKELNDFTNFESDFLNFTKSSTDSYERVEKDTTDILDNPEINTFFYWQNLLKSDNENLGSGKQTAISRLTSFIKTSDSNAKKLAVYLCLLPQNHRMRSIITSFFGMDQAYEILNSLSFFKRTKDAVCNSQIGLMLRPFSSFFIKNGWSPLAKVIAQAVYYSGKVQTDSKIGSFSAFVLGKKQEDLDKSGSSFRGLKTLGCTFWDKYKLGKEIVLTDELKSMVESLIVGDLLDTCNDFNKLIENPILKFKEQPNDDSFLKKLANTSKNVFLDSDLYGAMKSGAECLDAFDSLDTTTTNGARLNLLKKGSLVIPSAIKSVLFSENADKAFDELDSALRGIKTSFELCDPSSENNLVKRLKKNITNPRIFGECSSLYNDLTASRSDLFYKLRTIREVAIPAFDSCYNKLIGTAKFFKAARDLVNGLTKTNPNLIKMLSTKLKTFNHLLHFVDLENKYNAGMEKESKDDSCFSEYEVMLKRTIAELTKELEVANSEKINSDKILKKDSSNYEEEDRNSQLDARKEYYLQAMIATKAELEKNSTESFIDLLTCLDDDIFKENSIDLSGGVTAFLKNSVKIAKVSSVYKKMKTLQNHFHPAYHAISELLSYVGMVQFIEKQSTVEGNNVCPVNFLTNVGKVTMSFKKLWNPTATPNYDNEPLRIKLIKDYKNMLITNPHLPEDLSFAFLNHSSKIIPSSFCIGAGTPNQNILLTGSNANGKSTFMRSIFYGIHLGMTFGFVPATEASLSVIHMFFSLKKQAEDPRSGVSSHEGQCKLFTLLLEKIEETRAAGQNCFVSCDELFNGTNARDASSGIAVFAEYLDKYIGENSTAIISSHSLMPDRLALVNKLSNNSFGTYELCKDHTFRKGFCDVTATGTSTTADLFKKHNMDKLKVKGQLINLANRYSEVLSMMP